MRLLDLIDVFFPVNDASLHLNCGDVSLHLSFGFGCYLEPSEHNAIIPY